MNNKDYIKEVGCPTKYSFSIFSRLFKTKKKTQAVLATQTESVNNSLVLIIRIGYISKHHSKNKKHIAVFVWGHIFLVWLWI